jgi:hypothetical protein
MKGPQGSVRKGDKMPQILSSIHSHTQEVVSHIQHVSSVYYLYEPSGESFILIAELVKNDRGVLAEF